MPIKKYITEHPLIYNVLNFQISTIVIADETGNLIQNYIQRYIPNPIGTYLLITNRYHQKIDRDGVAYIIKKHARIIRNEDPSFPEYIHCHTFRHSKAMHMLEAGINIIYIRNFLGHEDISTTRSMFELIIG